MQGTKEIEIRAANGNLFCSVLVDGNEKVLKTKNAVIGVEDFVNRMTAVCAVIDERESFRNRSQSPPRRKSR